MTAIRLSWPHRDLSPNARKDRRWTTDTRAAYRKEGWAATHEAGLANLRYSALSLRITFHPPDARARDLDNMLASIKAGLDGISDATGSDDSGWNLTLVRGAPERPHGAVLVEVGVEHEGRFVPLRGAVS